MASRRIEILVGVFMTLGLAALLILALQVSNLGSFGGKAGYQLHAQFENIGGLKVKAPVTAGGVKIGHVTSIGYDTESFEAVVTIEVEQAYDQFPVDSSASIYTAGILGEQYIAIEPGADDELLVNGDSFELTQSALVLERLVSQFLFSKSGSESE